MNAKICDRCGAYYHNRTIKNNEFSIIINRFFDADERVDLCEDCLLELNKFMEGKKNDTGTNECKTVQSKG